MKRLLITGGKGFLGRACLEFALMAGFEIHATSSRAEVPADLEALDVKWHVGDLLSSGAAEALVTGIQPTHILHLAWETGHGSFWSSPSNLSWLKFGTALVSAFAQAGGARFVSAGTCAEYSWKHGIMLEEATPEIPETFYGRIKLVHHKMLMASAAQFGFSAATGRIFFGYGPYEKEDRLIPYACRQLAAGREANFTSGNFQRDFMHATDISRGLVAILDSALSGPCNVSSGTPTLLRNIATLLGEISGRPELIRLGALADRQDDPPMIVGNNERLRSTGWEPTLELSEGLARTLHWWASRK